MLLLRLTFCFQIGGKDEQHLTVPNAMFGLARDLTDAFEKVSGSLFDIKQNFETIRRLYLRRRWLQILKEQTWNKSHTHYFIVVKKLGSTINSH
ncbi:hypothetical protein Y032_0006g3107 [Ancylostoma ceylanicum]|uniref:Uncharacterized protein n=1 Tax=Ancylostoma ceylanicum TaxID=53326 RepID=A0A016VQR9_9BILA|nr:hypothetical protein Y032_0006g3107 [Ancylostoma ceylanicum]